jgi:predicted alpha/beta superfamily hydrolase
LIRTHDHFKSKALTNERTLWVWLPPDYETKQDQRYPVLYMHDGQNLFDAATAFIGIEWGADETADRLIRAGKIPPIIIVGIANTPDRMSEYTPWVDKTRKSGGRGEAYAKFLIDEVKPFIDKTYRTQPDRMNTGVAGSSLGGLISLHLVMTHPETFSKCAAISPALMWADGRIMKDIEATPARLKGVRLWFDMGTREGRQIETFSSAAEWTRRLARTLEGGGLKSGADFRYLEVEGGEHNEAAWAVRFDQVLMFLFGSE